MGGGGSERRKSFFAASLEKASVSTSKRDYYEVECSVDRGLRNDVLVICRRSTLGIWGIYISERLFETSKTSE